MDDVKRFFQDNDYNHNVEETSCKKSILRTLTGLELD